jgi:predicted RNA-binding protein (virulence factor B family)
MALIGKTNWLPVLRSADIGLILDGGDLGEILMPNRYVSMDWKEGEPIEVFLMLDSEDRLTATTEKPLAMVGEFALLRVVAVTGIGAFLDWGLPKDLLVPFREQKMPLREGQSVIVRIYLDELSGRIAASAKLDKFLDRGRPDYQPGEKVNLLICSKTDLGYKAIINDRNWGVLFENEVFQPLEKGQRIEGYIKQVRFDGKIDLSLQKPGAKKIGALADVIVEYIKEQGGFMPVTDKSPPEEIYRLFGVSKKTYKRAIGGLYKKRLITFENGGTRLV